MLSHKFNSKRSVKISCRINALSATPIRNRNSTVKEIFHVPCKSILDNLTSCVFNFSLNFLQTVTVASNSKLYQQTTLIPSKLELTTFG